MYPPSLCTPVYIIQMCLQAALRREDRVTDSQASAFSALIQYRAHINWAKPTAKDAASLIFLIPTIKFGISTLGCGPIGPEIKLQKYLNCFI